MIKRKIGKIISVAMASAILFSMAACGGKGGEGMKPLEEGKYTLTEKGTPVPYASVSFDFIGGSDVMPIGGFWGPYESEWGSINGQQIPNILSEKSYQMIHEAGVNMVVRSAEGASVGSVASAVKQLEYGDKYGVGVFAAVSELESIGGRETSYVEGQPVPFNEAQVKSLIGDLAKHESFLGVSLTDEPFWYQMDGLEKAQSLFEEWGYSDDYIIYTNVLNWEVSDAIRGGNRPGVEIPLDTYYDRAINDVGLKFLSATGYYFEQKDTPDAMLYKLFDALSGLRKYSNEYNVPMWRMLQAGGQWNDLLQDLPHLDPYPNEGETLFDVNMALAYGAKAIQYFPLVEPYYFSYATDGTYEFNRNGLISATGNKTQWYYFAQKANKQIAAIDHVLMNSANVGLIAHGQDAVRMASADNADLRPEFIQEGKFRQLSGVEGDDCYIGCFDYYGGTALYVVNYDRQEKAKVSLKFDGNYGYEVIQRAKSALVMGGRIDLTLEAGEGVLVVLK